MKILLIFYKRLDYEHLPHTKYIFLCGHIAGHYLKDEVNRNSSLIYFAINIKKVKYFWVLRIELPILDTFYKLSFQIFVQTPSKIFHCVLFIALYHTIVLCF